jgi:hypothetical protein
MFTVSSSFGRPALERYSACFAGRINVRVWPIRISLQRLPFSEPGVITADIT